MLITDLTRNKLLESLPKDGFVAEIGVYRGGFSEDILRANQPKKLHLIDLWGLEDADLYSIAQGGAKWVETLNSLRDAYVEVQSKFAHGIASGRIEVHRSHSCDAAKLFPDRYFDWIYIDAMHDHESVFSDLQAFKSKIKPGGFILGHDFHTFLDPEVFGVVRAVREFILLGEFELLLLTNEKFPSYLLGRTDEHDSFEKLKNDLLNRPGCSLVEVDIHLLDQLSHTEVVYSNGRKGRILRLG